MTAEILAGLSPQASAQECPILPHKEVNGTVTKATAEEEQNSFLPVTGKVLVEHESSV